MKAILFLTCLTLLAGCQDPEGEKYFDRSLIPQLELADLDDFWTAGVDIDTSYAMGYFENSPGYEGGIRLYAVNGKAIWVTAFTSGAEALHAMETRIANVACIIQPGDKEESLYRWWYSDCMDFYLYVSQHNTIIEINFSSNATFGVVKGIMLETAEEVAGRIDRLSE